VASFDDQGDISFTEKGKRFLGVLADVIKSIYEALYLRCGLANWQCGRVGARAEGIHYFTNSEEDIENERLVYRRLEGD
jgi:hypothetical protein